MKKLIYIISLSCCFTLTAYSANAADDACAQKRVNIEKKLAMAQEYNNTYEIAGLKIALESIANNCSIETLISDAESKVTTYRTKHAKKLMDLTKTETELAAALATNNNSKIQKYEDKISEIQVELQEAQEELDTVEAELDALTS